MLTAALDTIKVPSKNAKVLFATTFLEFKKRYSGSLFGILWAILYPLMFLGVYLFLYLIVFKVQYPDHNTLDSVIYIFSGLVPYIAFMETCSNGCSVIKQNIHLVKNVILPLELIPLRVVLMALVTELIGLLMIFILVACNHGITVNLLMLPVALFLQILFISGIALMLAPLGLVLPDVNYFINIITLLLLFVSPIGFMASMLSSNLHFIINGNPIYYMIEPYRMVFFANEPISVHVLLISACMSVGMFLLGSAFFQKFKDQLAEYI